MPVYFDHIVHSIVYIVFDPMSNERCDSKASSVPWGARHEGTEKCGLLVLRVDNNHLVLDPASFSRAALHPREF